MTTSEKVLQALGNYDLKKIGANSYRSRSPLRNDSDTRSFSLIIHDEEHGAWKDFVSEESGSLYDLAKRIGVEIVQNGYKQPAVQTNQLRRSVGQTAQQRKEGVSGDGNIHVRIHGCCIRGDYLDRPRMARCKQCGNPQSQRHHPPS